MNVDQKTKDHPDYGPSYFAGLNGEPQALFTLQGTAGYEAGARARAMFESAGFMDRGDGEFSMTLTVEARP